MKLIWKLLRRHISIFELSVFFLANLIGMIIILCGVQIYSDLKPMFTGEESLIGNDYVIITKPVERVGRNATTFTREEVDALGDESFVVNIGEFVSSQYEVYGSIMFGGRKISTMMFFESVPDMFIDVETDKWHFSPDSNEIPIIIPRNYLNLYNFGFSHTQNLPQITENLIKSMTLTVELSGNGQVKNYTGRVVGFSDRLNTILVPMDLMIWANNYYANTAPEGASRLIIEVRNPGDPEVVDYLAEHGFVAEEKPSESSKALLLLKVCIAIIILIGLIFSILSIVIFTLSIYLLLQKNSEKLENLVLIGHKPSQVARPYNLLTIGLTSAIAVVSIIATLIIQHKYSTLFVESLGAELNTTPYATIIVAIVLTLGITLFNLTVIRRKVAQISRKR